MFLGVLNHAFFFFLNCLRYKKNSLLLYMINRSVSTPFVLRGPRKQNEVFWNFVSLRVMLQKRTQELYPLTNLDCQVPNVVHTSLFRLLRATGQDKIYNTGCHPGYVTNKIITISLIARAELRHNTLGGCVFENLLTIHKNTLSLPYPFSPQ